MPSDPTGHRRPCRPAWLTAVAAAAGLVVAFTASAARAEDPPTDAEPDLAIPDLPAEEALPPGEMDDPPPPPTDAEPPSHPRPRADGDDGPGADDDRRPLGPRFRDRDDRDGDGRDRDRRRPPWHGDRDGLSDADLDRALAVLEKVHPEIAARVQRLRAEDPERAAELLRRSFPRLRQLLMLQRIDPEMFELKVEDLRLARVTRFYAAAVRQARAQGNDTLATQRRATLERMVGRHYDVRLETRQLELRRLEQRIEALRAAMEHQRARRDAAIARQVAQLAGDDAAATRPAATRPASTRPASTD